MLNVDRLNLAALICDVVGCQLEFPDLDNFGDSETNFAMESPIDQDRTISDLYHR